MVQVVAPNIHEISTLDTSSLLKQDRMLCHTIFLLICVGGFDSTQFATKHAKTYQWNSMQSQYQYAFTTSTRTHHKLTGLVVHTSCFLCVSLVFHPVCILPG